jgi:hypothetical protein
MSKLKARRMVKGGYTNLSSVIPLAIGYWLFLTAGESQETSHPFRRGVRQESCVVGESE